MRKRMLTSSAEKPKTSGKKVYQFLELFDIMYEKFTDSEKKEFLASFIREVEIWPECQKNGQILKSLRFRFPVYYQGQMTDQIFPNKETTVETVVSLLRKTPDEGCS